MKSFRKPTIVGLLVVFFGVVLAAAPSFGGISVVYDPKGGGLGGGDDLTIAQMDWAVGNSLAVGGNVQIENFVLNLPQTPLQTFFQATLAGLDIISGGSLPVGLGSTWETTAVAAFQEIVTGASAAAGTANFKVVGGGDNYFEIWGHSAMANANNLAGTGFNDGTLILSATIQSGLSNFDVALPSENPPGPSPQALDQRLGDNYPGQLTMTGQGNTTLQALVNYTNPLYFVSPLPFGAVLTLDFASTLNSPLKQVDPSAAFLWSAGGAPWQSAGSAFPPGATGGKVPIALGAGKGANAGAGSYVYGAGLGLNAGGTPGGGVAGPDVQFQADASQSFDQIPEPTSVLVWTLAFGTVGLVRLRRRRKTS